MTSIRVKAKSAGSSSELSAAESDGEDGRQRPSKKERGRGEDDQQPAETPKKKISMVKISSSRKDSSSSSVTSIPASSKPKVSDGGDAPARKSVHGEVLKAPISNENLEASLKFLKSLPNVEKLAGQTNIIEDLMRSYLPASGVKSKPTAIVKPTGSIGEEITPYEKVDELEQELIRKTQRKQPPPPPRPKMGGMNRSWIDPREHQRMKMKQKQQWPPKGGPDDRDNYVVESYGQTDPYSKNLIKNIQKEKRLEIEKAESEKRAETVEENLKPVSILKDTFTTKPEKVAPGVVKPTANVAKDVEWIKHEKAGTDYAPPPEEPKWMNLIRNRRWKSTVKARFPCQQQDLWEFERRSTTPKNWKKLAKDKTALKMLSEMCGIGAEGEELFQRLAEQRQTIEQQQEQLDRRAEEELMAYEIARESMGGEAAYSMQKNEPAPSARQHNAEFSNEMPDNAGAAYPFTTSQLEAAFLTNQLLKLHPEEFRKLMSLERSRQATLRWQFSADPFDSVHDHQDLPYEIAILASEEPHVRAAMRRYLEASGYDMPSGFSTGTGTPRTPRPHRRTRSEGGMTGDGCESAYSVASAGSGRKRRGPPPPVKPRGRNGSVDGDFKGEAGDHMAQKYEIDEQGNIKAPNVPMGRSKSLRDDYEEDLEVHAHGLLTDAELQMSEELAQLQEMTRNIRLEVDEDLRKIQESVEIRSKNFLDEAAKDNTWSVERSEPEDIDKGEIAKRRTACVETDKQASKPADPRENIPKNVRHQVRHISSDKQLKEVFKKRRAQTEVDDEEEDEYENTMEELLVSD